MQRAKHKGSLDDIPSNNYGPEYKQMNRYINTTIVVWSSFLYVLMLPFHSIAQSKTQSLLHSYNEATEPAEIVAYCLDLERAYRFKNRDSSLYYVNEGIRISKQEGIDSLYLTSANRKASLLGLMANAEGGIQIIENAFQYAQEKDITQFETTYAYRKGLLFQQLNQPDSAIFYLLKYKELSSDSKYMGTLTLGQIYSDIGDRALADKYLYEALNIVRVKKKAMDYLYVLSSMMDIYESWDDFTNVSSLREEYLAYKLNRGDNADKVLQTNTHAHVNLPDIDLNKQIKKLKTLIPISKKNKDYRTHAHSVIKLSKILNSKNKHREAIKYLEDGLASAKSLGNKGIIFNLEQMNYLTYKELGNINVAFNHLENTFALKDTLRKQEVVKNSKALAAKYETEKKENQITLLKSEDKIKSLQLQKAKQSRGIFAFGLLGSLFFLSLVGYLYLQNRKRKIELQEKNKIIKQSLQEKSILLREIHHRVKNNLQVVSSILNLQSNYISDKTALAAINEGKNRVGSMALIHSTLYQDDNVTSIEAKQYFTELISSLYESYEINEGEIALNLEIDELKIDVDTMVPLGLVVNELISNALKHAFKPSDAHKTLSVTLRNVNERLEVRIKDNGKGMSLEEFTSSKSFGNKLIQAFKQKLKADLQIINDNGTEIIFSLSNFKLSPHE